MPATLRLNELNGAPKSTGSATGTVGGFLVDSGADFVSDGVAVGDEVHNSSDDTFAHVVNVDNGTTLELSADIFTESENYSISGEETPDVENSNYGSTDGAELDPFADPIEEGENGFEKYQRYEVTDMGGVSKVRNLRIHSEAHLRASGSVSSTSAGNLVDAGADFTADGVKVGDTVLNITDSTSTTVTVVTSGTTLALADDIFESGDEYEVRAPLLTNADHLTNADGDSYDRAAYATPTDGDSAVATNPFPTSLPGSANLGIHGDLAGEIETTGPTAYSDLHVHQVQEVPSVGEETDIVLDYTEIA